MSFDIDSLDIDNGASAGGGGFFKPAEHSTATLIVIEPKGSKVSQYAGDDGQPKTNAVADFTIFSTKAELENGKPGVVLEDGQTGGVLANIIIEKGKGIIVGTVEQTAPKGGRKGYWKISPVDPALIPKVKEYLVAREAEKSALPDFMG